MKKIILLIFILWTACNPEKKENEDIHIWVDESLKPIALEFKQAYLARKKFVNVHLHFLSGFQVIKKVMNKQAPAALLTRPLNAKEISYLRGQKIIPDTSYIAHEPIVLIANKKRDKKVFTKKSLAHMLQKPTINKVFLGKQSSVLTSLNYFYADQSKNFKKIFSVFSYKELIHYICQDKESIGFLGFNAWRHLNKEINDDQNMKKCLSEIKVFAYKDSMESQQSYLPGQSEVLAGLYPFFRSLIYMDFSGKKKEYRNFGTFLTGEIGQKLIQIEGLIPNKLSTRYIQLNNNKFIIEKD